MRASVKRFLIAVSALLMPIQVLGATFIWDGGGSDNNWSTAANWDGDAVPGGTGSVLFDGTGQTDAVIDASFAGTVKHLTLGSSFTGTVIVSRALTVSDGVSLSGGTLQVNGGNVITDRGSWINDGATLSAGTGTIVLAGTGSAHTLEETETFNNLYIDNGLIGYWKFDETSGTTAIDSSRSGYTGEYVDGPVTSTTVPTLDFPNAASRSFDGDDDHVIIDGLMGNPINLTISVWFNMPVDQGTADLVSIGDQAAIRYSGNGGQFTAYYHPFNWNFVTSTSQTVDYVGTGWHHLAYTVRASDQSLYANGSLAVRSGWPNAGPNYLGLGTDTFIGSHGNSDGGALNFLGLIDDVRIYNRALSASEVAALAAGGASTGSGRYTLGAALDIDGTFGVYSGMFDPSSSSYGITSSGGFVNHGDYTTRSTIVTLDGPNAVINAPGTTVHTLAVSAGKKAGLQSSFTISSALTIGAGSTLRTNGNALTATDATIANAGTIAEGTGSILHTSSLSATSSLDIGSSLVVTLADSDENLDGTAADTTIVNVGGETITLTETGDATGVFTASVQTSHGPSIAGNDAIENDANCSFTVTSRFVDPEDSADSDTAETTVTDSAVPCEQSQGGGGRRDDQGTIDRTLQRISNHDAAPEEEIPAEAIEGSLKVDIGGRTVIFRDVPVSSWFAPFVFALASAGVVSGYEDDNGNPTGFFGPSDPVTYAEIAKMALEVAGKDPSSVTRLPLNLSARNTWAEKYVTLAEDNRLSLYASHLNVHAPASRGEVIRTVLEALQISFDDAPASSYDDLRASHPHAKAIMKATLLGIVSGDTDQNGDSNGTFRPDESINRAEAAKIIATMRGMEE